MSTRDSAISAAKRITHAVWKSLGASAVVLVIAVILAGSVNLLETLGLVLVTLAPFMLGTDALVRLAVRDYENHPSDTIPPVGTPERITRLSEWIVAGSLVLISGGVLALVGTWFRPWDDVKVIAVGSTMIALGLSVCILISLLEWLRWLIWQAASDVTEELVEAASEGSADDQQEQSTVPPTKMPEDEEAQTLKSRLARTLALLRGLLGIDPPGETEIPTPEKTVEQHLDAIFGSVAVKWFNRGLAVTVIGFLCLFASGLMIPQGAICPFPSKHGFGVLIGDENARETCDKPAKKVPDANRAKRDEAQRTHGAIVAGNS